MHAGYADEIATLRSQWLWKGPSADQGFSKVS